MKISYFSHWLKKSWQEIIFFGLWCVYFALFWSKALFYDYQGNLVSGHVNIWGDWAAHFTMATAMAERSLLLDTSPFLIGHTFSYPFVSDMISALLLRLNVPFILSFTVPSFVFSLLVVTSLYWLYKTLFTSSRIAMLATCIFLFNGGLGFYYFAQDVWNSPQPLDTIINLPHEYTRLDKENIKWISVIDSMIIPQRAFTLGFPLTLIALTLLSQSVFFSAKKELHKSTLTKLITASLILGVLPVIHTHSFLAAFIILAVWSLGLLRQKNVPQSIGYLLIVGGITSLIALPLLTTYFFSQTSDFITWYPGWYAKELNINWLWFWFNNWSITPLLALISWILILKKVQKTELISQLALFAPFFLLFILANLWLFQPFIWDNTKLIIWSSVGFSGLVALLLGQLWQNKNKFSLGHKSLAAICFLVVTTSGMIDSYWILRHDLHHYVMYNPQELELSQWALKNSPTDSVWLTGDQHNHWLYNLTGRQPVLVFRGWLWTHGYEYHLIEADAMRMFASPSESTDLFQRYNIEYVVVGNNEKRVWGANVKEFDQLFPVVQKTDFWTIYKVTP